MKKAIVIITVLFLVGGCAVAPGEKKAEYDTIFYPPVPEQPRLQFLHLINSEDDVGKTSDFFEGFLTGKPQAPKSIGRSWDIGSCRGKIYVLDRDTLKVAIIDLAEKKIEQLRDRRLGRLYNPTGIWVTGDDFKYVTDQYRKQVVVFDKNNEFVRTYGDKNLFSKPLDVAVYGNFVYVIDMDKNQLFFLDKNSGKNVKTVGKGGEKEGLFHKPTHVVVDHAGNIFVTDAFNFRVQQFDPEGKFVKSYGRLGDTMGSFARPKGLSVAREGHLYVADTAFQNVQIFDVQSAQLLLFFGGAGNAPGSMNLPAGVHVDYENVDYFKKYADKDFQLKYLVYVGSLFGAKGVNIYGFGEWTGPPLSGASNAQESQAVDQKKKK